MSSVVDLFFGQQHIGSLDASPADNRYTLTYTPEWVATGFPLSPSIPFGKPEDGAVRRYLQNLLPEGQWLDDLAANYHLSKQNVFGLVRAMGSDVTGGVLFLPLGMSPPRNPRFREVPKSEMRQRIAARANQPIWEWDGQLRLSVAGLQEKLPILRLPDGKMGLGDESLCSTHILKMSQKTDMHLVLNEYICMTLARDVGLPVAPVKLLRFDEPVLEVQRFDRELKDNVVKRNHIIDGCQLLDLPPEYKYERNLGSGPDVRDIREGASLPRLFGATETAEIPAVARLRLLQWSLFQLLIQNPDAHGKNISFFVGRRGLTVAPAYDLLNIAIYKDRNFDRELAMAVGDEFDSESLRAYQLVEMANTCSLKPKWIASELKKIGGKLIVALDQFRLDEFSADDKEHSFGMDLLHRITLNTERLLGYADEIPELAKLDHSAPPKMKPRR